MTTDKKARKEMPIARGVLDYFPDAIAAVANVSYVGNQQHNPGQPMHWAREKSTDHADCIARHLIEAGTIDDDGMRHSAKMAWRALALLQVEIDAGKAPAPNRFVDDEVQHFNRIPIEYVPSIDNQPLYSVYAMTFTEAEPEETDPRTEALDDYLRRNDVAAVTPDLHRWRLCNVLENLGCAKQVIEEIVGGASVQNSEQYVYIAGPMRGCDKFNFPAFDAARDEFLQNGWNVISPADIDRAAGFSESVPDQPLDQRTFAYRDFYSLYLLAHLGNGAIAMLPGWEKSTGATAEFFLARWLGLKILDARSGQPLSRVNVNHHAITESVRSFLNGQK